MSALSSLTNRERLILLNLVPQIGSNRLRKLLAYFGSLEDIFSATSERLRDVGGIGPATAAALVTGCKDLGKLEVEVKLLEKHRLVLLTYEDEAYPPSLRSIYDPPIVIYAKGNLPAPDSPHVAIVGTRAASTYGLRVAERLAYDLAQRGVAVVSGMARGIDAAAHAGALKAEAPTVAVLGSGLLRVYPPEHADLAERIAQAGAVISEFPLTFGPLPGNFPRRNRIVSGLCRAIVIVEAARRSGAMITTDLALEQGRDVLAVPGPIDAIGSQGTLQLIRQGAGLVTSADDVLEAMGLLPAENAAEPPETAAARLIVAHLDRRRPLAMDQLAERTGLTMAELSAELLRLELARRVRQLPGKRFLLAD